MAKGVRKKTWTVERDGVMWLARKKPGRPKENGDHWEWIEPVEQEPEPVKPKDGIARFDFGHVYLDTDVRVLKVCPKCTQRNHYSRCLTGQCVHCGFNLKGLTMQELEAL